MHKIVLHDGLTGSAPLMFQEIVQTKVRWNHIQQNLDNSSTRAVICVLKKWWQIYNIHGLALGGDISKTLKYGNHFSHMHYIH